MAEITTWNGKPLIPLSESEPLKPGDVILIQFAWLIDGEWYRAYEWMQIEKKLEGRRDWRVVSYRNEGDFLWAEIEVLAQPEPVLQTAGIPPLVIVLTIGAIFVSATYALARVAQWKFGQEIRQTAQILSQSGAGKIAISGVGAAGWAVLIGVVAVILYGTGVLRKRRA